MKYIIILVKEIEYFTYYFYLKNVVNNKDIFDFSIASFSIFSIANLIWGLYQIIKGIVMYYGIGCLSSSAPAHSGGVFLMITFFYFFLFIYKNNKYFFLFLASAILTISTVSRTAILGLIVFVIIVSLYFIIKTLKKSKITKKVLLSFVVIVLSCTALFAGFNKSFKNSYYYNKIIARFHNTEFAKNERVEKWKEQLNYLDSVGYVFGRGKGYSQYKKGSITLNVDSEYVNKILECGIIGLIVFQIILIKISTKTITAGKIDFLNVFIISIVLVYMVLGVTMEIFSTLLQASLFWTFIGLFNLDNTALISKKENKHEE